MERKDSVSTSSIQAVWYKQQYTSSIIQAVYKQYTSRAYKYNTSSMQAVCKQYASSEQGKENHKKKDLFQPATFVNFKTRTCATLISLCSLRLRQANKILRWLGLKPSITCGMPLKLDCTAIIIYSLSTKSEYAIASTSKSICVPGSYPAIQTCTQTQWECEWERESSHSSQGSQHSYSSQQ